MKETFETIQSVVNDTAAEIGLSINTSSIFTSSDKDAKQLAKFAVATAEELLTKYPWRSTIGNDPWVQDSTGNYKYKVNADEDVIQIDARLLKLGCRWRYLHSKGLKYNEDFRTYQLRIQSYAFNQNKQRDIDLNDEVRQT